MLKITIDIIASIFQVHIIHNYLHSPSSDHFVSDFVKIFIKKNINLLSYKIYANLVSNGIELSIN